MIVIAKTFANYIQPCLKNFMVADGINLTIPGDARVAPSKELYFANNLIMVADGINLTIHGDARVAPSKELYFCE